MIIYNVTLKVAAAISEEWKNWMLKEHIPGMLALGLFVKNNFSRLLDQDESDGQTFVAQYFCKERADYEKYLKQYAPAMRQKGLDKFGDKVLGFRTIMEVIEQP